MYPLSTQGSAIHTQLLLSKAISKNKVTTSDLKKCLKSIRNLPAENHNHQGTFHFTYISQILNGQNSNVLDKKIKILNKIFTPPELINRSRPTPTDRAETGRVPLNSSSRDSVYADSEFSYEEEAVYYSSTPAEANNIHLNSSSRGSSYARPECLNERQESTGNQIHPGPKSVFEKSQQLNSSTIEDSIKNSKEKRANVENKLPTELDLVRAKILKKPVEVESQNIAQHSDNIPVYATVQKRPQMN